MNVYELQQLAFMGYPAAGTQATSGATKKVHNYVFKLNEVLGKGNFSTVYKGHNELNSKDELIQTSKWLSRSLNYPASKLQLLSTFYIPRLKSSRHSTTRTSYAVMKFSPAQTTAILSPRCALMATWKLVSERGGLSQSGRPPRPSTRRFKV